MLQRNARLRRTADIQAVRRANNSWRHSLLILAARKNGLAHSRFGFICSRRVGKAVVRNRARRLMRESIRANYHTIESGWDCLLIARPTIQNASFFEVETAVRWLFKQAKLLIGD